MDDQVKKKVVHREKETKAVLQDIETRTVELERQKALLEQELLRCEEEVRKKCLILCLEVYALCVP